MGTHSTALVCRAILGALLPAFLFGCAISPFTSDKVALIHAGMTTDEVEKLFGPADSIRNTVCGKEETWHCEIWTYGGDSYPRSTFWFSVHDGRHLDQWDVTRAR